MASATRETVTKEIVTTEEESVIRLDLTERQAKILVALTRAVSGQLENTWRKETNEIKNALQGAGAMAYSYEYFTGELRAKPLQPANYNLFD